MALPPDPNSAIETAIETLQNYAAQAQIEAQAPERAAALDRRLAAVERLLADIRRIRAELLNAMPGQPFISPWI